MAHLTKLPASLPMGLHAYFYAYVPATATLERPSLRLEGGRQRRDIRPRTALYALTALDVCDDKARRIGARHRHHLHRTRGRLDGGGVPMWKTAPFRPASLSLPGQMVASRPRGWPTRASYLRRWPSLPTVLAERNPLEGGAIHMDGCSRVPRAVSSSTKPRSPRVAC